MAVVKLSPVVASIADVIALFDRIMVYRSTTGASGTLLPLTTFNTAIPLVVGQSTYDFEDLNGDSSYYYCVQYVNSDTGAVSAFSTPLVGSGDSALSVITIDQLKTNYLFGLDLTDSNGNPMPDSLYTFFLRSAVSTIEKMLDIPISTKIVTGERHDFTQLQRNSYSWIQLDNHLVQSVQAVRVQYPGNPIGQPLPAEWQVLDVDRGTLQLIPRFFGGAGAFYEPGQIYNPIVLGKYIPGFYSVDYTAGFPPGQVPPEIAEIVGMQASLPVLDIIGDLLGGAGVSQSSISIDGLSQSVATTTSPEFSGLGARVKLYNDALAQKIPILRKFYAGMALAVS